MNLGDYNRELVKVARLHVGLRETGHNSGPVIDDWLIGAGSEPGQSWCAAAVHGCASEAADAFDVTNPCPRTASVLRMWDLLARCRVPVPYPGCLYFISHGGGLGHVGIVESVGPGGDIVEMSGNTNARGSREGNAFERHVWNWMRDKVIHGGALLGWADLELALMGDFTGLPPSPF